MMLVLTKITLTRQFLWSTNNIGFYREISTIISQLSTNEPCHEKICISIWENKGADQLYNNNAADRPLCFRYIQSTISLLHKSEISSPCRTAWFVSDLVRNPEDRFSRDVAHITSLLGELHLPSLVKVKGSSEYTE